MTRKFKKWWKRILSLSAEERALQMERWLYYAGKTAAFRGDQNQQRVIYTIHGRFKNSTYKRLTKANAWRVWSIINQKQTVYRRIKQDQNTQPARRTPEVVIKKKTQGRTTYYTRSTSYDSSKGNI
jgi:hypothetical protein